MHPELAFLAGGAVWPWTQCEAIPRAACRTVHKGLGRPPPGASVQALGEDGRPPRLVETPQRGRGRGGLSGGATASVGEASTTLWPSAGVMLPDGASLDSQNPTHTSREQAPSRTGLCLGTPQTRPGSRPGHTAASTPEGCTLRSPDL